jgi:hypothetical protein
VIEVRANKRIFTEDPIGRTRRRLSAPRRGEPHGPETNRGATKRNSIVITRWLGTDKTLLEFIADQLSLLACLVVLWTIAICAAIISIRRYADAINPVTGALASQAAVTCLLSAAASSLRYDGLQHSEIALKEVMMVSSAFVLAVVAGASIRVRSVETCLSVLLRQGPAKVGVIRPLPASAAFLLTSAALLAIVAFKGGGGMMWIEQPRIAYLTSRAGVGLPWAASGWALTIAVTLAIYQMRSPVGRMAMVALGCILGLQLGSKAVPLAIIMLAMMHQHRCVKPLRVSICVLAVVLISAVFSAVLWLQSYDESASSPTKYLAEYSTTAARGIDMLGPDGCWFSGTAWVTSLWEFVPRGLVSEKPFVYGLVLFHDQLNPGMAELGHTPGVPSWMLGFMEAGLLGVVTMGFVAGQLHSAVFHVIGRRVNGPANLLLLTQVGVFPILLYSNALATIGIYYLLGLLVGDLATPISGASQSGHTRPRS